MGEVSEEEVARLKEELEQWKQEALRLREEVQLLRQENERLKLKSNNEPVEATEQSGTPGSSSRGNSRRGKTPSATTNNGARDSSKFVQASIKESTRLPKLTRSSSARLLLSEATPALKESLHESGSSSTKKKNKKAKKKGSKRLQRKGSAILRKKSEVEATTVGGQDVFGGSRIEGGTFGRKKGRPKTMEGIAELKNDAKKLKANSNNKKKKHKYDNIGLFIESEGEEEEGRTSSTHEREDEKANYATGAKYNGVHESNGGGRVGSSEAAMMYDTSGKMRSLSKKNKMKKLRRSLSSSRGMSSIISGNKSETEDGKRLMKKTKKSKQKERSKQKESSSELEEASESIVTDSESGSSIHNSKASLLLVEDD
ncbi:hypothetical protein QOT17_005147 [Balamuthia mandrillaris]